MGCGKSKSKQDVATGNTVVRKNSVSEEAQKTSTANLNQIPENTEKVESTVEIGSKEEGDVAVEEEETVKIESERVISGDSPNQFFAAVSELNSEFPSPLPHGSIVVQDEPILPEEVVAVDCELQSTTQIINERPGIVKEAEAEVETTVPAAESSTSDVLVEKKDEKVITEE